MADNEYNKGFDNTPEKIEEAKQFGAKKSEQDQQLVDEKSSQDQNATSNLGGTGLDKAQNPWGQTKQPAAETTDYSGDKVGQAAQPDGDSLESTKQIAQDIIPGAQDEAAEGKDSTVDQVERGKHVNTVKTGEAGVYTFDSASGGKDTALAYIHKGVGVVKDALFGAEDQ